MNKEEYIEFMEQPTTRDRPYIPQYGIEESDKGLLDWEWVEDVLRTERNYWICTTRPDGRPHTTPVWGIWLDNTFYFGGGPQTRKAKNLRHNPNIAVHTESRDDVVIVEGTAVLSDDTEIEDKVRAAYEKKYDMDHPPPFWTITPLKVLAWKNHESDDYRSTPTRFKFTTE